MATRLRSLHRVSIFALLGILYGSFQESAFVGILAQLSAFHGAAGCFSPPGWSLVSFGSNVEGDLDNASAVYRSFPGYVDNGVVKPCQA